MTGDLIEPKTVADILAELNRRLDHKPRRKDSYSTFGEHLTQVPCIECEDGFAMSVQASAFHYCTPRESEGPWCNVEVGFPTARVDALMPWMEDWGDTDPTDAVYAYTPIEVVAQVIADHGGFKPTTAPSSSSVGTDERSEGVKQNPLQEGVKP